MPAAPDAFNQHFIGTSNSISLSSFSSLPSITPGPQFEFKQIMPADILEEISSACSNAIGPDQIPLRHLKDCLPILLDPLTNTCDSSLRTGYFPMEWKKAVVRPLPKKKDALQVSDFRPISIFSAASKLLEFVALKQMSEFISEHSLLCEYQLGFRKGCSTHTAIIRLVDDFLVDDAIDKNLITLTASIDFTCAFDMVQIPLFIRRLRALRFSDAVCRWVESYLSNPSQVVIFANGECSSPLPTTTGVPQGNLPGPLFSLFINDLPKYVKHCKFQLYANDFIIYLHGDPNKLTDVIYKINEDLASISRWAGHKYFEVTSTLGMLQGLS